MLLASLSSAVLAQADSTATDSAVLDSTATDTLFLFHPEFPAPTTTDTIPADTAVTDTLFLFPPDLSIAAHPSEMDSEEEKPLLKITPWEFRSPVGSQKTATDSTLRWQNWPDWTYKLNRDPGVISYRLGTNIRTNAVQRHAHEPRHQQLYWEDILLNDPVSGIVNWSLIPIRKIRAFYDQDFGTIYQTKYYNHQYYINKPLSRLIYSESKFSYSDLEFEVSHNLSQRTNIELSYWDRRSGGEYDNSDIFGQQIYTKISHHLDPDKYLKLNYIANSYEIGEPFGYNIPDLQNFHFDRYNSSPNQPSAVSDQTNNVLALNYYQRPSGSPKTTDNFRAGIFYKKDERLLDLPTDTTDTGYSLRSMGANSRKWWHWGGLQVEAGANYEYFINKKEKRESLSADNWSLVKADGSLFINAISPLDLKAVAEIQRRSDGFQSYRLNAEAELKIGRFTLSPGASSGSVMPTPQQLYWDTKQYKGDTGLNNEHIQEVRGTLSYHFNSQTKIGVRGQHKDITDGIMVSDSLFTNIENYASQSATAFFEWDLTHFEFEGSATMHQFADSYTSPSGTIPMSPQERVWLKGSAYWKGYLFDRATYVKAGVSGMTAPVRYQADHYYPELNYWQSLSSDQYLPTYNRLDVDISARVRSIMFILRWENVLDDVSQLGYFETAQYPMSQRRFIFSVRALFRN